MIARLLFVVCGVVVLMWGLPGSASADCHQGVNWGASVAFPCGEIAATASGATIGLLAAAAAALAAAQTLGGGGGSSTAAGGPHSRAGSTPFGNRCGGRDPVDLATGEMINSVVDVGLAGVLSLALRRTHISSYRAGRLFGPTWASTLDQRLEVGAQGIAFLTEDGMCLWYQPGAGDESVMPVAGPRWPLSRTPDGGYVVSKPDQRQQLWFGQEGEIRPLLAVTDLLGHRVDIRRDAAGTPTEVVHSGGYRVVVRSSDGLVTGFDLAAGDDQPTTLVRYGYDAERRLVEVVNSTGAAMRYAYDPAGRVTRWEDRVGQWYAYVYDEEGRVVRTEGTENALAGTLEYGEQCTVVTDSLGNATTYRFNGAGQVVRVTDPLGRTTISEWDPHDRLLARIDPVGRVTKYEYDQAGNLTTLTRPDGTQVHAEYNALGLPTRAVDADGAVRTFTYDERGLLLAATDPAGAVTRYGYDEHGHLSSVTDAAGTSRLRCDAAGLLVASADPSGAVTRYDRDRFGRVVRVTDPAGAVTTYTWTVEDELRSVTLPDGTTERWRTTPRATRSSTSTPPGR